MLKMAQQESGGGKSSPESGGGAAVAPAKPKPVPRRRPPGLMPQWKVLLHNDDINVIDFVILSIVELTTLNEQDATLRAVEAHQTGVALLLTTHQERAELYRDQFTSKGLTVTIEPAE